MATICRCVPLTLPLSIGNAGAHAEEVPEDGPDLSALRPDQISHDPGYRLDIIGGWRGFQDRARHQPRTHFHSFCYSIARRLSRYPRRADVWNRRTPRHDRSASHVE